MLDSHRITLDNGFVIVYSNDKRVMASFQAPQESTPVSLLPWLDKGEQGAAVALHGPLTENLFSAAQRKDVEIAGRHRRFSRTGVHSTGRIGRPTIQGLQRTSTPTAFSMLHAASS